MADKKIYVIDNAIINIVGFNPTVTLENEQTRKREVEGLKEAARTYDTTNNVIITLEQEQFVPDNENMRVIPVWRFLLDG